MLLLKVLWHVHSSAEQAFSLLPLFFVFFINTTLLLLEHARDYQACNLAVRIASHQGVMRLRAASTPTTGCTWDHAGPVQLPTHKYVDHSP